MQIIRAENGTHEEIVDVERVQIPDLWHVAMRLKDQGDDAASEQILGAWHLAHDMRGALHSIAQGARLDKPIHTK